ncbi:MAG: trans-sulfuration enzyme family protein [Ilumatobacteraceae bacterium]
MSTPFEAPGPDALRPGSKAIRAGRRASGSALAPALWASSVWQSSGLDDANARATALRGNEFYSRYSNPTVRSFEEAIAELEGGDDALAFASGMGALASTVLAVCSSGDHIVAQRQLYAGTLAFLQGPCARLGIDVTLVDGPAHGAFAAAVQPGRTMLVLAETPSNPRLEIVDLDELAALKGPLTVVDSTFATPIGQQPLAHGVDLVVHSATKGIAGHNDATLGVVAGEQELLDAIWSYAVLHGATPSPFDALNALRGVRTLAVRTAHQTASAQRIAEWLADHPSIASVYYPGLITHPQHDLAKRQMRQFGTVLSFELGGGHEAARALLARIGLCRVAASLGGPESLLCHPATSTHVSLTAGEQAATGVTPGLVRMSVGLEDPDDLINDLTAALRA